MHFVFDAPLSLLHSLLSMSLASCATALDLNMPLLGLPTESGVEVMMQVIGIGSRKDVRPTHDETPDPGRPSFLV